MTQKHTPLPWRLATKEEQMGYIGCHIMGANRRPVASTVDPLSLPGDLLENKANGLLILQACNAHDELLAALGKIAVLGALSAATTRDEYNLCIERELRERVAIARAAIAKATSPQAR